MGEPRASQIAAAAALSRGASMARRSFTGCVQRPARTLLVLIAAGFAPTAGAEDSEDVPARHLMLHSTAEIVLLARGGALDVGRHRLSLTDDPTPVAPLRRTPLPRGPDPIHPGEPLRAGAPLYGLLAGHALLSALQLGGSLPAGATPWFDGDARRMTAGIEFSF